MDPDMDCVGEVPLPDGLCPTGRKLYVGSLEAAQDGEWQASAGVTHVLTAAGRLRAELPEPTPAHLVLNLADHPTANILAELDSAMVFCDAALGICGDSVDTGSQGSILVHCASGVSRSVSICVALLIARGGLSYDEALARVKTNRPHAGPNVGFEKQLRVLEECKGDITAAKARWSQVSPFDVMDESRKQRDVANALHAEIDELENTLVSERAAAAANGGLSEPRKADFLRNLDPLRERMDSCMADSSDRPARMILKAAVGKAGRLITELGG